MTREPRPPPEAPLAPPSRCGRSLRPTSPYFTVSRATGPKCRRQRLPWSAELRRHHVHEFLDGSGALVQRHEFIFRQLGFVDLLDALGAELDGHPDEQVPDAVLAFQVGEYGIRN